MSGEIMTELDHSLQATIDEVSESFFPSDGRVDRIGPHNPNIIELGGSLSLCLG
jgi:hypothetical protein